MQNQRQIERRRDTLGRPEKRKTVVIADDGVTATVILLNAADCASAGSHFEHRGRQWVIRGQRHHSRVLMAEPLGELRQ